MQASDLKGFIQNELSEVRTCLPGIVQSYNGTSAVVKPALPKQLANGDTLPAPQIVQVPVCFHVGMGGKAQITVPLAAGDDVILHFSERSLENWLNGSDSAPDDPRQFDLSDCFASPVLRPTVGGADPENVSMMFGDGNIKIAPSGEITVNGPRMTINAPLYFTEGISGSGDIDGQTMQMNGPMQFNGDAEFNGQSLKHLGKNIGNTHKHKDVQPGSGNTGDVV